MPLDSTVHTAGRHRFFGALQAAVRATRTDPRSTARLGDALLAAWSATPEQKLSLVAPDRIRVGDETLEADASWSFVAFMAGVREISLERGATSDAVSEGIRALARLDESRESIAAFADWAFEHQGEGFGFVLHQSFSEAFAQGDAVVSASAFSMRALRAEGCTPLGPSGQVASDELSRAAARPELDVLGLYESKARERELEINATTFKKLSFELFDEAAWADCELDVLLTHPALRASVPAAKIASRLLTRLERRLGAEVLDQVLVLTSEAPRADTLRTSQDAELAELLTRGWSGTLAAGLARAHPPDLRLLDRLTDDQTSELARAVCALPDSGIVAAWHELESPSRFLERLRPAELSEESVLALAHALGDAEGGLPLITWSARLSDDLQASLLTELPPSSFGRALPAAVRLIALGHPIGATLVERVFASPDPVNALGALLLQSTASALDDETVTAIVRMLRRDDEGRASLERIVASRSVTSSTRVLALQALAGHPAAVRRASAWSFRELFEPRDLAIAKQSARRALKLRAAR
jgi:hypothetical protein